MAKITIRGSAEYALKLSRLGDASQAVAKRAVYKAANIVADEIRSNLSALSAVDNKYNIIAYNTGQKSKLSKAQKQGLLDGLGITPMREDGGFWNVKIGMDGYNSIKTDRYPQGQPNVLVARVVEGGSQYMNATPFIRPAVNTTRKKAVEAMEQEIDKTTNDIMR